MTFITNNLTHGIEIGSRGITAWQQANNLYCLDLWEPKALPSADPRKLCPSNPVNRLIPALASESESSGSNTDTDTDTERLNEPISEEAVNLWNARMCFPGRETIIQLAKVSRGIDLTKTPRG